MLRLPTLRSIAALSLVVLGSPLAANPKDVTMEDQCRREVVDLHRFFQDWFNAEKPNNSAGFNRIDLVLSADFEIIGPDGVLADRDAVLKAVHSGHGRNPDQDFHIEIRKVRSRTVGEGMVLVTYEEHQDTGAETRAWLSSALFRSREEMPNGVEWVHVQETYLPQPAED